MYKIDKMNFKVDTKEKFVSILVQSLKIDDIVADELAIFCTEQQEKAVKNIIINMEMVESISEIAAEKMASLQQKAYENNNSFVICCVQETVESVFEQMEILEMMNITPTESEAWDIVQMEEIERELLDGDDFEFEKEEK